MGMGMGYQEKACRQCAPCDAIEHGNVSFRPCPPTYGKGFDAHMDVVVPIHMGIDRVEGDGAQHTARVGQHDREGEGVRQRDSMVCCMCCGIEGEQESCIEQEAQHDLRIMCYPFHVRVQDNERENGEGWQEQGGWQGEGEHQRADEEAEECGEGVALGEHATCEGTCLCSCDVCVYVFIDHVIDDTSR